VFIWHFRVRKIGTETKSIQPPGEEALRPAGDSLPSSRGAVHEHHLKSVGLTFVVVLLFLNVASPSIADGSRTVSIRFVAEWGQGYDFARDAVIRVNGVEKYTWVFTHSTDETMQEAIDTSSTTIIEAYTIYDRDDDMQSRYFGHLYLDGLLVASSDDAGPSTPLVYAIPPQIAPMQRSPVYVYSLPDAFLGQDPTSLDDFDLHASVFVSFASEGRYESTSKTTPFSFEADVSSQVSFAVESVPSGSEFLCAWDHYGSQQHNTCALTIEVPSGPQKIAAFFKQTATETITLEGTYVDLKTPSSYVEIIRKTHTIEKLDRAYELLWDFTSIRPYGGEKILVILDPETPEGLAYAGNPIRVGRIFWSQDGPANVTYHEMAHDFMGIPEFDRIIFPSSPFVEGFGELGRQYIYYQVDRSMYEQGGSRYLKELREQYLDAGLPFEQLKPGPSAGILQDLTNLYGFDMWKSFFRIIYDLDVGPKEDRTLQERCCLFIRYLSEAAGEDLTDHFLALRFPLPRSVCVFTTTRTTAEIAATGTSTKVTTTGTSGLVITGTTPELNTRTATVVTMERTTEGPGTVVTWWDEGVWWVGGICAFLIAIAVAVVLVRRRF